MPDLEGAVAVVTGAASGIGHALAEELASHGATVVLADVDGAAARARASDLGPRHRGATLDVRDPAAFQALAEEVRADFGGAQVLVNNAGVAGPGGTPVWQATPDDWAWVVGVNLLGVVNGLRAFMPQMLEGERNGRSGHVVTVASLSGLLAFPFSGPYTASKHAAVALTEQVDAELRALGSSISVTVVCPAWVRTGILDSHRLAPDGDLSAPPTDEQLVQLRTAMEEQGLEPSTLARHIVRGMGARQFSVLPADMAGQVLARADRLAGAGALLLEP
jgi:NAD(P)-dependent dehydrogenase (short-subunit alcohol dehydrogenase family)